MSNLDKDWKEYLKTNQPNFEGDPEHLRLLFKLAVLDGTHPWTKSAGFFQLFFEKLQTKQSNILIGKDTRLHNLNLKGAFLKGLDLKGLDLEGADLTKSDLNGVSLIGTNLEFVNFYEAEIMNANLSESVLRGVNLKRANLKYSNLHKADLKGAELINANLVEVDLRETDIQNASFAMAQLNRSYLSDTKAQGADFYGANLGEVDLRRSDMKNANMQDSILRNSYLTEANLNNVNLEGANLEYSDLRRVDLKNANLKRANLRGVDLKDSNLEKTNLSFCDLSKASLEGVRYRRQLKIGKFVIWSTSSIVSFKGISIDSCKGNAVFKRYAMDEDYIEVFKGTEPRWVFIALYYLWKWSSNCGRSMVLWILWSIFIAIWFAAVYGGLGTVSNEAFVTANLDFYDFTTLVYYSVVTFTTLGFGDITPTSALAARWVMAEVITGYIMLGGLISIFATKLARRS